MANTKVTGDLIASLTIATGNIADNAITSDKISGLTTAHITEGTNLYYTDARARAAVSVSGNALSYNSSTGVITSNFEESPTFTGNVVLNGDGNALKWTPTSYDDWTMTTDSNGLVIYNITDARYDLKISGDGNSTFAGNVGIGVAAHGTASLNITNTDQHIRLNNGSELGVISLDTDGKLDFWAHGTDETINFRTGTGSGTVTMSVVGEKVGIGTTSPSYKLAVNGDLRVEGNSSGTSASFGGNGDFAIDAPGVGGGRFVVKHSTGNVGIGTSSPAAKLHVEGTIKLGGYSYIGEDLSDQDSLTIASDYTEAIHFAHFTPATSTYSTNMIIDNSGNVGIGTSSPTESKLVISGGATGTVGGGDAGITMINKFDNPDNSWSILPVITGVANTGFSIRDNTDSTDRLVINGSGNVGIGTNSPETNAKLDVRAGSGGKIVLGTYDANYKVVVEGGDQLNFYNGASAATAYMNYGFTGTPGNILLSRNLFVEANSSGGTSGTVRIKSDGKVGIGTTTPDRQLEVYGVNDGYMKFDGGRAGNHGFTIGSDLAGFIIYDDTLSTYRFVIDQDSGNVGIGADSPSTLLHLNKPTAGDAMLTIQSTSSGDPGITMITTNDRTGNIFYKDGSAASTQRKFTYDHAAQAFKMFAHNTTVADFYASETLAYFPTQNVGIGTTNPGATLEVNTQGGGVGGYTGFKLKYGTSSVQSLYMGQVTAGNGAFIGTAQYRNAGYWQTEGTASSVINMDAAGNMGFYTNSGLTANTDFNISERMRITASGKTLIGTTSEQNAGTLQVQSGGSENGGTLDIAAGGFYRYYTRVCRNATSVGTAGYWHIKTNIAANSNTMFLAKFYGYIYGSAQILDLQHAGYAYSGTSTVINQGATNNGTDPNASSAVYISANGSKVTFRIAFGSGSNFSTYFAGVFMDMAFPSPAGQGHDFEIEAQSFSTSTTVY